MARNDAELKARSLEEILPNSSDLGKKPDVLFGCNTSELSLLAVCSIVPGLLSGVLGSLLFGFQFFAVFLFVVVLIVMIVGVRFLRRLKRQKPSGHYLQLINRKLSKISDSYPIIEHVGAWQAKRLKVEK